MSVVVSDTTPLNYLVLIGQIEILPRLFGKVLVPPAVIAELSHAKTPASVGTWAKNLPEWIEVRTPTIDLHLDIGTGEDQAISLAVELGNTPLLVDDRKARAAAVERGILTFGTIAILDLADEAGSLDFEEAVARLRATSFHLEDSLLQPVLQRIRQRKSP